MSWDQSNERFSISAGDRPGNYTVSGTIRDNSNNSSSWSFTLTVLRAQVPTLTASAQTVEIGGSLNYAPTIGNVRAGESYTVTVSSVPSGAPVVTWDSSNSRFSINAGSASLGEYSISGNIKDTSNNTRAWSFTLTVSDTQAPTLTASDRSVRGLESLNHTPIIGNLRSGEGYTVTISSITPSVSANPSVSWDQSNERFSISVGDRPGNYTVSGTIRDASNNSSSWSFNLRVRGIE